MKAFVARFHVPNEAFAGGDEAVLVIGDQSNRKLRARWRAAA